MQKIDDLLTEGHRRYTPLHKLLVRASDQEAWTAQLQALLPAALRNGIKVTANKGTTLVVACRNASIATRLRFLAPELVPKLRVLGHFAQITQIRVRVAERQSHDFDAPRGSSDAD